MKNFPKVIHTKKGKKWDSNPGSLTPETILSTHSTVLFSNILELSAFQNFRLSSQTMSKLQNGIDKPLKENIPDQNPRDEGGDSSSLGN